MGTSSFALTSIGTKTIGKVRARILPFIFLLYIVAFLDRNNIGFRDTATFCRHGSGNRRPG